MAGRLTMAKVAVKRKLKPENKFLQVLKPRRRNLCLIRDLLIQRLKIFFINVSKIKMRRLIAARSLYGPDACDLTISAIFILVPYRILKEQFVKSQQRLWPVDIHYGLNLWYLSNCIKHRLSRIFWRRISIGILCEILYSESVLTFLFLVNVDSIKGIGNRLLDAIPSNAGKFAWGK